MPTVSYGFTEPFIETTDTGDAERALIALHTRKWRHLSGSLYRVWLRLTVTEFGERVLSNGLNDQITAPDWWGPDAEMEFAGIAQGILDGTLSPDVIDDAIGAEALVRVEELTRESDGLYVTLRINAPALPVSASLGAFEATFDPRGDL